MRPAETQLARDSFLLGVKWTLDQIQKLSEEMEGMICDFGEAERNAITGKAERMMGKHG